MLSAGADIGSRTIALVVLDSLKIVKSDLAGAATQYAVNEAGRITTGGG